MYTPNTVFLLSFTLGLLEHRLKIFFLIFIFKIKKKNFLIDRKMRKLAFFFSASFPSDYCEITCLNDTFVGEKPRGGSIFSKEKRIATTYIRFCGPLRLPV